MRALQGALARFNWRAGVRASNGSASLLAFRPMVAPAPAASAAVSRTAVAVGMTALRELGLAARSPLGLIARAGVLAA